MRKSIGVFALMGGLLFAIQARADVCGSVAGNLVTDCGFETGGFNTTPGPSGTAAWTFSGNTQGGTPKYDAGDGTYDNNQFYGVTPGNPVFPANSGADEAYFGTYASTYTPLVMSQSLTTTAGQGYTIHFYLSNDTSVSATYPLNEVQVMFGGLTDFTLIDDPANTPNYTEYTAYGFATGATTTLAFDFQNDGGDFYLDDVSVTAGTPEPASLLLVAPALAGLIYAVRRRRKA